MGLHTIFNPTLSTMVKVDIVIALLTNNEVILSKRISVNRFITFGSCVSVLI